VPGAERAPGPPSAGLRSAGLLPLAVGHGRLPDGVVEWAVFLVAGVVTAWVLWKAVRYTFEPGEDEADHVKRSILDAEDDAFGSTTGTRPRARSAPPSPRAS